MAKSFDPVGGFLMNLFCCGALGYFMIGQKSKAIFGLIYSIIIFVVLAILAFIIPEVLIFLIWVLIWIITAILFVCAILCCCIIPWTCCICWCAVGWGTFFVVIVCFSCGVALMACVIGIIPIFCGFVILIIVSAILCVWCLFGLPIFVVAELWGLVIVPFIPLFTYASWVSGTAAFIFVTPFMFLPIIYLLAGLPWAVDIFLLLNKKKGEEVTEGDNGIGFFSILPGFKAKTAE